MLVRQAVPPLVRARIDAVLIEARSCERFKMLWKNIPDESLSKFYYELMISEAGHYKIFLQLAKLYQLEEVVMKRWGEFLEEEAIILKEFACREDRMH